MALKGKAELLAIRALRAKLTAVESNIVNILNYDRPNKGSVWVCGLGYL